jgi:WD40 repeat protein
MVLSTSAAWALTPTVVWQTSGAYPAGFSADGSAVFLSVSSGFQMRRATDGLLLKSITLPSTSLPFDKSAFSPDKQFVAISVVDANLATRIEIWSLSTGNLVRTIPTTAVRNIRGLDFSPNSAFLASMERFAYGGGGKLRIFRTSDGALLREQGPFVVNGNTFVKFSPGGTYLAFYQNQGNAGFNILRTSDWSTAQSINLGDQYMIQWAGADTSSSVWLRGNFSISVPYRQVAVPGGAVARTLSFDDAYRHVSGVTSNNKYFLAWQVETSDPGSPQANTIWFLRTSDAGAQLTYTFSSTIVSSGTINPAGTQFTYAICPDTGLCTAYVAQMPTLP